MTLTDEQKKQSIEELTKTVFTRDFVNNFNNFTDFCELIEQTSAYNVFYSKMIVPLTGTEKQTAWAGKIRDKKIKEVASQIVRGLVLCKLGMSDIDFNKYANAEIRKMKISDSRYWIENRY